MTSIPLFRNGQGVFRPPFPERPTERTPGIESTFYVQIDTMIVQQFYSVEGPACDTGGIKFALADEVAESTHTQRCGRYWCLRWTWLNLYYSRPDNTPPEPRQPHRYARLPRRSHYESSDPPSLDRPYLFVYGDTVTF